MQQYSTGSGSHPCSVAVADFNNDNHLDIAAANSGTSDVGIFLGNENGTFTNVINIPTGEISHLEFIVVDDFTNDSKVDIVVIDSANDNAIVLEGDGNGNFTIITIHSTGYDSDSSSIAIGDFDHDNIPDIAITNNASNNILVLISYIIYPTANQVKYQTGTGSNPASIAVGDLNNDNHSDIVVANTGNNSTGIFLNLGDGTFGHEINYLSAEGSQPYFVVVDDINKDDKLDIITVLYQISEIQIFIGYGNGTFNYGHSYSTGTGAYPEAMAMADLNYDNNLDIIVANSYDGVGVLLGKGDGTFTNITTYLNDMQFNPRFVVVADLNNDKILDVVASDYNTNGLGILLGTGDGSFDKQWIYPIDDRSNCFAIGDLNNDHYLDIVYVSAYTDNVGILFGYGNATFGSMTTYFTGRGFWPWYVILNDFNNDALLDIAICTAYGYYVGIFFGFGNGSFSQQWTFPTGYDSLPSTIASGDFNNDNQLDIAVTDQKLNRMGVFLLHYVRDFTHETIYLTGSASHPYSVAIGNFNQDNQSDIVVANSGNDDIQLLLNYYQDAFLNEVTYSTGFQSYPQFVSVADFNRDGKLDIAVANNINESINVFLGYGNSTFDAPSAYWTGTDSFPISIAVGDFNKDNWTDMVVANNGSSNISVFLGFNYATFTNETLDISGPSADPMSLVVGDFNNDHYDDLAVTSEALNYIRIYLGYGNGSFAEQTPFSTGDSQPTDIAVGDFNRDNQLDFVVIYQDENNFGIFLGYGNGSFANETIYSISNGSSPQSVSVGDFNNDNILDIVVANQNSNNIGIFMGYGDGKFSAQIPYSLPDRSSPTWAAVADFNNDNNLDIAVCNYGRNNIGIFFGFGNGSFNDMILVDTGNKSQPSLIATGDLNNDTWIDIAVAIYPGDICVFLGYGNGTFSLQTKRSASHHSDLTEIIIADLNNDGNLDVAASNQANDNGNVAVLYGYGDGHFALLKTYSTGWDSNPSSIAVGDFNNDNQLDLAVCQRNHDSIGIMLRKKSEPFTAAKTFSTGDNSNPQSVVTGDFNNDDQLDIAVANSANDNIGIFLGYGYGNGNFAPQQTYSIGNNSRPVSLAVGDFNNDHHLDIALANSEACNIVILLGFGNGSVAILRDYSTGIDTNPSAIAGDDLNGDNHLDIVVTNYGSNELLVFLGFGNGTFFDAKSYSLGYNTRPQSVAIGDVNNDGLLDIVVANYGGDYVQILLQTC
jgi:hypothetical protein